MAAANTSNSSVLSSLSTHVLNTSTGTPGRGVSVTLERPTNSKEWKLMFSDATDNDGRISGKQFPQLEEGVYRLTFDSEGYFAKQKIESFYPSVSITFKVSLATSGKGQHYHVPCLLSPFGFTTYRGS